MRSRRRSRVTPALEIQHAVLTALLEHPSVAAATPQILAAVCSALNFEVGAIWMVDSEGGVLRCSGTWARDPEATAAFLDATRHRGFVPGEGLPGRVWQRAESLTLSDVTVDGNFPRRPAAEACNLRGAFAFPVFGDGRVLGVIEGFSRRVGVPDAHMRRAVQSVGRQVGLAVLRERSEHERTEVSARLATLIQNLNTGILVEDQHRRIALVNEAFCDLFHIPSAPDELVGADYSQAEETLIQLVRSPGDFATRTAAVVAACRPVFAEELSLVDRRILERDYVPIMVGGTYAGHLWAYRDVTAQREAQGAVAASEERLRAILDAALDCAITIDTDGNVLDFNAAAERTFGFSRDRILGRPMVDHIIPDRFRDAHRRGVQRYLATGEGPVLHRRIEVAAKRADGSELPVELAITPVRLASGREIFTAFLRDITERKKTEEDLQAARVAAERSAAAKEQLLAHVSHELRTPLNAIVGLAHLLEGTQLDAPQVRSLQGIRFAADTLLEVINDLLDFARMRSGHIAFESEPFEPRPVLQGLVDFVRASAEARGLFIALDVDGSVPDTVVGDPSRLNQVLLNLVGNAIKFTKRGGVTIRVNRVTDDNAALALRFSVSDTGIGVPEGDHQRIFDAFQQVGSDTMRQFGGSGLGLAIVKEVVQQQGGTVTLESAVGVGSAFHVTLPFGYPEDRPQAVPAESFSASLAGRRLLLVEDNEMNRFVATQILQRAGAVVATASNGREGVERVRAEPFDLVLMDIQMPEMDGFEATWRIRHDLGIPEQRLPIIALTATALTDEQRRAQASGMTDFLLKPFRPDVLCQRVASALAGAERGIGPASGGHIDRRVLEEQTLGQPGFAREVIDLFLDTVPSQIDQLDAAAASGDLAAVAALAHRMKSQAGTIGATGLQRALAAIEDGAASSNGADPPTETDLHAAGQLAREVLAELEALRLQYQERES